MSLYDFVKQSNAIEGISHEPLNAEIDAHRQFLAEPPSVSSLSALALSLTGGRGRLRVVPGMDVRVGSHLPPPGGDHIVAQLRGILEDVVNSRSDPWTVHVTYETLHPFLDGNGRTGRALWLWQVGGESAILPPLSFLHAFYYQTLQHTRS
jgi:hypothetical protein